MKNRKGQGMGAAIGLGALVLFFVVIGVLFAGFDTVDASHKGVKVKLGEVKGTMDPGLEWTGMFVDVHQYNLRTRKMEVKMEGAEGAVDRDGQAVYARIEINYRLNPASVEDAYKGVGKDHELENVLNIDGIIREGFKSVTSNYTSLEIFQKRPQVKGAAIARMKMSFPEEYFVIENVVISNLDFNAAFKAAIESKKVAEETAKAEQEKVKIAEAEANFKIATAEGAKKEAELVADAQAYQKMKVAEAQAFEIKAIAEAEADGIRAKGLAEADALRKRKAELTDDMVKVLAYEAWAQGGSQVPQTILGGDGAAMIYNLPEMK